MDLYTCPRCSARCWVEEEQGGLVRRCICGLLQFLSKEGDAGESVSLPPKVEKSQVKVPHEGTKIYKCLRVVIHAHPVTVKTESVTAQSGLQRKETAALLVALLKRGLIDRVEERRGITGGSFWALSTPAEELLIGNQLKGE